MGGRGMVGVGEGPVCGTRPQEVEERKCGVHRDTAVGRALPQTWDLLDMKSGVPRQRSPTKTVTQSLSGGFYSLLSSPSGQNSTKQNPEPILSEKPPRALPDPGKTLKSPKATKPLHNLTFAPAVLSIFFPSYMWLQPHGLCMPAMSPPQDLCTGCSFRHLSSTFLPSSCSLLAFRLRILKSKHWPLQPLANLPTECHLPDGTDLCQS